MNSKRSIIILLSFLPFLAAAENLKKISIGDNTHIEKTIEIDNNHIVGGQLTNHLLDTKMKLKGEEFVVSLCSGDTIYSNSLKINDITITEVGDIQILKISFDKVEKGKVNWQIDLLHEYVKDDFIIKKHIVINTHKEEYKDARIDYIDMDCYDISLISKQNLWSRPDINDMALIKGYYLSLGQPIYANSFFFGSEFPEADTRVIDSLMHSRYYCGKNFKELEYANKLDIKGGFVTWKNIVGASHSESDFSIIRNDFFRYINRMKKPSPIHIQYNCWLDWYMTVNTERFVESITKMENGFTKSGVRPLDCYVLDNGWNAYAYVNNETSSPNQSGFWEFNDKFPNELDEPFELSKKLGSSLGLWMSPRGGYSCPYEWAKYLEDTGNATLNRRMSDIVSGDSVYCEKMLDFMLGKQRCYNLTYWKLDGFCAIPPQPSENGRYITGGFQDMYYITEHWERWISIFEALYKDSRERGLNLWLNLTTWVNPSPWMLQYCNSIYIQGEHDFYDEMVDGRDVKMEKQINYRDDMYFYNQNVRQWQFPVSSYFHHDPCFGKEEFALDAATDDEFRMYLYMIAMRGSGLWDMLYSSELLDVDNRWLINSEVLSFAEENQEILKNSVIFGKTPLEGSTYGYSAWNDDGTEGFVALRNPSNSKTDFGFSLNNRYGINSLGQSWNQTLTMRYPDSIHESIEPTHRQYGDSIVYSLGPGEVVILHFTPQFDTEPPIIRSIHANDSIGKKIVLDFSEKVIVNDEININVLDPHGRSLPIFEVNLLPNHRTMMIELEEPLSLGVSYKAVVGGVLDYSGNVINHGGYEFEYFKNSIVFMADTAALLDYSNEIKGISGEDDFCIQMILRTPHADKDEYQLLHQGGDCSINLVQGRVVFKVGELSVETTDIVTDANPHMVSCNREANGMLKIYLDGQLQNSMYGKGTPTTYIHQRPLTYIDEDGIIKYLIVYDKSVQPMHINEILNENTTDTKTPLMQSANEPYYIFDLSGKLVWSGDFCNRDKLLKKGIYVEKKNDIIQKRIIK